jgi:uncharacterized membrane protein
MNKSDLIARTALASLLVLGVAGAAGQAVAADNEKCAGIAKAGKNDCATKSNSCSGQVKADGAKDAWIYLPRGTCERIAGGLVVASTKK